MSLLEAFWKIRVHAGGSGNATYSISDKRLTGTIGLTDEISAAFSEIEAAGDLIDLKVAGSRCPVANLPSAGEASFTIRAPKAYFENLAELLDRHPQAPPPGFKVFDIVAEEEKLPLYIQAAQLATLLGNLSATKNYKGCVLFANGALEIPFSYFEGDLRTVDDLNEVCRLMSESESQAPEAARMLDVYRGLFRQALSDVLSPVPKEKRFAYLLANFAEVFFRFRLSFRRFSDEANAAIERYEQTRAAMISALNGVLGNIQTSLIGVPLAGLLALKEMKPAQGWTFENVMIVLAVVTVGGLLMALSFSQGKTLEAINEQYKQLKKEIDDSGGGKTKLGASLTLMAAHQKLVWRLLIAVRLIIGAFVGVAVGVLFVR